MEKSKIYDQIRVLINTIKFSSNKYADTDLDVVERAISSFNEYLNYAYTKTTKETIIYARYSGDCLRLKIEELNKWKNKSLIEVENGIKILNRICKIYDVDSIYNITDINTVEKFANTLMKEIFKFNDKNN